MTPDIAGVGRSDLSASDPLRIRGRVRTLSRREQRSDHRNGLRRADHGRLLRPSRPRRHLRRHRRGAGRPAQRREIPIVEPGLENLVRTACGTASCASSSARRRPSPTPSSSTSACRRRKALDGSADLSYIEAAAQEISPLLQPESIVVNKSTVPVGSTKVVERALGRPDVSRRVEPRVPPRGLGGPRLPAPRPRRDRQRRPGRGHPRRRRSTSACRRRSSSPTRPRPRRSSTPPTPSWPPSSRSSTPSPPCARPSAPT